MALSFPRIGLYLSFFIFYRVNAQETVSFGLSGYYNFPLGTIGIGTRANIPLSAAFAVSPQIKYSPAFNDIHEFSSGLNLHYYFIRNPEQGGVRYATEFFKPVVYLLGGFHYNRWINYRPSINTSAKTNNLLPELGLGAALGGNRVKLFLEGKYNPLWQEPSAEVGLLVFPFNPSSKVKCYNY